jgi:serine/threonine-protein kinase
MKYRIKKLLLSNWLICSLLTLLIIVAMLLEFYPLRFLEVKAFDALCGLRDRNDPHPVVLVKIDDESVQQIGSWPWPRSYIADVLSRLSEFKPEAVGVHLLFPGAEINPGLEEFASARKTLQNDPYLKRRKIRFQIDKILKESQERADTEASLIEAVNYTVNAVLPIWFELGSAAENPPQNGIPDWVARHAVDTMGAPVPSGENGSSRSATLLGGSDAVPSARMLVATYEDLARKSGALGHINILEDPDGKVRQVPLLIRYGDRYFPAFGLQAAAKYLKADLEDVVPGERGLSLKSRDIPTDSRYRMFIDDRVPVPSVSFLDVYRENVTAEQFEDKIVLIGESLSWESSAHPTTTHSGLYDFEITARVIENILNRKHLSRPFWAFVLETMVVVYFWLFLIFVIPRVKPRDGALILGIFLLTWVCFAAVIFMVFGYWLKLLAPIFLTVIGFSFAGFYRFAQEKQLESIELNKMVGLSFQGKGMLDMAFEKYAKCPVENLAVRELLYNLGQDFERKRMFNKALAVYLHILKAGRYKDIYQRVETLRSLGESATAISPKTDASIILENGTTKPTLGRYEILEELGQGAMGTVYLGRDPKINREVAIKTLGFSNVEPDKLEEVKERFLKEAEAAGKLSHPNIVTIFDVGEEHDMAYMAMELLKGKPLSEHCVKGRLLPIKKVLKVVSGVAEALEYAHANGVVHRDIKPDNVMLMGDGQVKVADFGIARVMSTSQTQTGVILGTPNYMSPEQVEGSHVDGRSDLFSLGVVMYEMLSGTRPFTGDNMAHLMYNIANGSYQPITQTAPDVPDCCVKILKKLLNKSPDKRIPTAAKVIKRIRQCRETLA